MYKKYSTSAVSLLEVMVAIMIFFLWLISVYSVVSSTLRLNEYNKNYIIASNLAREQIEIVKNIRDYNFLKLRKWDAISSDMNIVWELWEHYTIENNNTGFLDAKIQRLENFSVWKEELTGAMTDYRLCIDSRWVYSYNCSWDNKKTSFYKYMKLSEVFYLDEDGNDVVIEDAIKFESNIIWYKWWYHSTNISIILTDWNRL